MTEAEELSGIPELLLGAGPRAALSAPAVPEGFKLVPIEPTPEMVKAGWIDKDDVNPDEIWAAMLAAAPSPQEQTNG